MGFESAKIDFERDMRLIMIYAHGLEGPRINAGNIAVVMSKLYSQVVSLLSYDEYQETNILLANFGLEMNRRELHFNDAIAHSCKSLSENINKLIQAQSKQERMRLFHGDVKRSF